MKLIINNFLVRSKQSWKEILIWGIIIWIITTYMLTPLFALILSKYGHKPSIILVVQKTKNFDFFRDSSWKIEFESYLIYNLHPIGDHSLMVINATQVNFKEISPLLAGPSTSPFKICSNCTVYSFNLKNVGNKRAQEIYLDTRSSIRPNILISNPKITQSNCGGIFGNKGCTFTLKNVDIDEWVYFELEAPPSSSITISSCYSNKIYECEIRIVNVFAQEVPNKVNALKIEDKMVLFPTLQNYSAGIYYLDYENLMWIKVGGFDTYES